MTIRLIVALSYFYAVNPDLYCEDVNYLEHKLFYFFESLRVILRVWTIILFCATPR